MARARTIRRMSFFSNLRTQSAMDPTTYPRNIPERENLHQKMITFGMIIWLCDALIHFLGCPRARNFKPAIDGYDIIWK